MKKSNPPIIVEQSFNTSKAALWAALTEVDQMTQWFFDNIPAFQAEVGFESQFVVSSGDRSFTHLWKVTEVIPQQKLTYSWRYMEYPGDSFVTFELMETGGQLLLRLSCVVLADFPDDVPEFRRESCLGGWRYFIGENLVGYLEG